ncbi:hypothetical protein Rhopal_001818-T1 [Rhodotorula paludigena]|uniref:Uncharacterized protein n=1 Tax=Rhodotorula paludigena TaxID=86838 RepID=A0AAV5GHL8_9BASI|nr:hypothetical protein Rhopal_001818-T1 [Rhodotorula paludigena]
MTHPTADAALAPTSRDGPETPSGASPRPATPSTTTSRPNKPPGVGLEVAAHSSTGASEAVPVSRTGQAKKRARQTGDNEEESSGAGSSSGGRPGSKKEASVSTRLEQLEVKIDKLAGLISAASFREDMEPLKVSLMAALEMLKSHVGSGEIRSGGASGTGESEKNGVETSEASKTTVEYVLVLTFEFETHCSTLRKESLGALAAAKDDILALKDDAVAALKGQVACLQSDITSRLETIETLEGELLDVKTNCEHNVKSLTEKHSRALEDRDRKFKEQEVALQEVQEDLAVSKATSTQDLKQ